MPVEVLSPPLFPGRSGDHPRYQRRVEDPQRIQPPVLQLGVRQGVPTQLEPWLQLAPPCHAPSLGVDAMQGLLLPQLLEAYNLYRRRAWQLVQPLDAAD